LSFFRYWLLNSEVLEEDQKTNDRIPYFEIRYSIFDILRSLDHVFSVVLFFLCLTPLTLGLVPFRFIMRIIALIASVITAIQAAIGLIYGSIICPNSGCKIVEGLTAISPLYLNFLGLIFFQCVFWGLRFQKNKSTAPADFFGLFLISGLVFDSVLLAYQIFVARTFCGYCLLIFVFVLTLNLFYGRRQMLAGITIMVMALFSFSVLTFVPTGVLSKSEPLKIASYGVKSCSTPTKEIFLIFSSDCPYCENVLQTLSNCNSCDLYLNPINQIDSLEYMELDLNPEFSPEINRLVLGVLGIDTVPVLVAKSAEGFRFIKGEKKILNYVSHACFTNADVLYYEDSIPTGDEGITVISDQEGECSVAIDCDPK